MALLDWSPNLVYVEGGNTFWLYHCMTKGDWQEDLVSAITSGNSMYCGKSAGAILAGKSVETATWKVSNFTIVSTGVSCVCFYCPFELVTQSILRRSSYWVERVGTILLLFQAWKHMTIGKGSRDLTW